MVKGKLIGRFFGKESLLSFLEKISIMLFFANMPIFYIIVKSGSILRSSVKRFHLVLKIANYFKS